MTAELYHYTGCGLDYVYLMNGFEIRETPYGTGISIQNADGLHRAITRDIIASRARLRGQEVRFLRGRLDLSQKGLGERMRVTRDAVAKWEAEPDKEISGPADGLLRVLVACSELEDRKVRELCESLREIDGQVHQESRFKAGENGWMREAA